MQNSFKSNMFMRISISILLIISLIVISPSAASADTVDRFVENKSAIKKEYHGISEEDYILLEDNSLWGIYTSNEHPMIPYTKDDAYSPYKIIDDVKDIQVGGYGLFVLTNSNELWSYGRSYDYTGTYVENRSSSLKRILTNVKEISIGMGHSHARFAIKEDGTLWGWGKNAYGDVGFDNNNKEIIEPIKVLDSVKEVGNYNGETSYAIKGDDSLWMWGRNDNGQAIWGGDSVKTPKMVFDDVKSVSILKSKQTYALKKDNTLWTWGRFEDTSMIHDKPKLVCENVMNFSVGGYNWGTTGHLLLKNHEIKPDALYEVYFNGRDLFYKSQRNNVKKYSHGIRGESYLIDDGSLYQNGASSCVCGTENTPAMTDVIDYIGPDDGTTFALTKNKELYGWGHITFGSLGVSAVDSPESVVIPKLISGNVEKVHFGIGSIIYEKTDKTKWIFGYRGPGDGNTFTSPKMLRFLEVKDEEAKDDDDLINEKKEISIEDTAIERVESYTYDGQKKYPKPEIFYGEKKLVENENYTLKYYNNKNIGFATIIVQGMGDYVGTKTLTFKIIPPKTSIKKITKNKNRIKVVWGKTSAIDKYQLRYKCKNQKKYKILTVSSKKVKKVIKTKKNKRYYFQVRSYKTVNNQKIYSRWSKRKHIKS